MNSVNDCQSLCYNDCQSLCYIYSLYFLEQAFFPPEIKTEYIPPVYLSGRPSEEARRDSKVQSTRGCVQSRGTPQSHDQSGQHAQKSAARMPGTRTHVFEISHVSKRMWL